MDLNKLVYKKFLLYTRNLLSVIKKNFCLSDIYSSLLLVAAIFFEKSTGVEKSIGLTVLSWVVAGTVVNVRYIGL